MLEFLPLSSQNWITCGNALRLDWLSICPPTGTGIKLLADDLFETPLEQAQIDFENEGGEIYICGNPPYSGQSEMSEREKDDLAAVFAGTVVQWKSLDYVAGWFQKAANFFSDNNAACAFVSTNSICQGQQVAALWGPLLERGVKIHFARTSFKWRNLARNNAGVTVAVVGIANSAQRARLYEDTSEDGPFERLVDFIGPYLVPNTETIVHKASRPLNGLAPMDYGSKPADGGGLILKIENYRSIPDAKVKKFLKAYIGSDDYIDGKFRYCLWITADSVNEAESIPFIRERLNVVREFRLSSSKGKTREQSATPYAFSEIRHGEGAGDDIPLVVPIHTSENREFLPVGALERGVVVSNAAFALYDAPLWNLALIASRLHLVWIATVCGKLETRYRYSNTLGWNTFPVPTLTEKNRGDLTRCAEDILLAREAHFPATIADLYDPDTMPDNLRAAHERNDEVLERIYIGRRFKNDTERLEKLFELYTQMTAKSAHKAGGRKKA
mgnify:CR=1 FL=1